MKRSSAVVDPPPQCALSPQDSPLLGNCHRRGKDDKNYPFSPVNRGSGRNPHPMQRQSKREPQPVTQAWSNNTFENSNTSWEGDWSNASSTPPIKTEPSPSPGYYNHRSYSSEWSPGESSTSMPSAYSMMHTPQQSPSNSSLSASSSSYYESNGFYVSGYNYGQSGYLQAPYGAAPQQQQQHQYHESVRAFDSAAGAYNNHRNPSSCPQTLTKQPVPDYQRKQMRYPMDGMSRLQIKREPEDYNEMDGENFTSLFTKSLTSLYSQDTENAFAEDKPYEPDPMGCSPLPGMEEQSTYQRLNSSGGQYNVNAATDYQNPRSNFGFYESRGQNCEPPQPPVSIVEELGADGDRLNSFRYDRPSFDDMHLYTSPPNEAKGQAKKRKINMPSTTPEGGYPGSENRKKTPRLAPSYKSDSQWTPNSFAFSDIQIKQEPIDDYGTNEVDTQSGSGLPFKESSPSSNVTGGNKSPGQQPDHPKQPPRKRSPGATCFDRFDKKSTPTNKKVSPLSVYAKVQENIVLSVKCRRYKKRTKPITCKEESICPGREEMEIYKQNSLTPDQAAHQVMSELLERVSLFEERSVIDGPNLTQMDAMKVRELLMQFCNRYSLDYRDFEDINTVLKPRIIKDNLAKNSERASAIRKRTSTSPVPTEVEPQPARKASSRAPKKASFEESRPAERRVLRSLPGRMDRGEPARWPSGIPEPVVSRRYSTRRGRDVCSEKSAAQVDIVISSSTDSESEAGKEAEVRKKSQRLKKKTPAAVVTPARSRTPSRASGGKSVEKRACTRLRENKVVDNPEPDMNRINLRSRRERVLRKDSIDSVRSSSVEILDVTINDRSFLDDIIDAVVAEPFLDNSFDKCKKKASKTAEKNKSSHKGTDKNPASKKKSKNSAGKNRANSPSSKFTKVEKEDSIMFLNSPEQPQEAFRKATRQSTRKLAGSKFNFACAMSELEEVDPPRKWKESSKKPSPKNKVKNCEMRDMASPASCDVVIVKEEFSPNHLKNSVQSDFDSSVSSKEQVNFKSHFSGIKMKEHSPKQLDSEFTQLSFTNSSRSSKILNNDDVATSSFVKLTDELKEHQEFESETEKSSLLSSSTKLAKLLKKNSKQNSLPETSDATKEPKSSKSFVVSSKPSKQPKSFSEILSDSSIDSDEPLNDLKKSLATKALLGTKSRKACKEDPKLAVGPPVKTCDAPKLQKERSRKPKSPMRSKTVKLKRDISRKSSESPEKFSIDFNKMIDEPRTMLALQPEVVIFSKPLKEEAEKSVDLLVVDTTNMLESAKEKPTASAPVQMSPVPSKSSSHKVDDLVAAVSSLVESENESKLLENDKKTIAAHSLLELGNSPQFLNVGSVPTSIPQSVKPEIIAPSAPLPKPSSHFGKSFDPTPYTDSRRLLKENYEKPEIVDLACNNSVEHDRPDNPNSPFAYYNSAIYEKPVAVNTPFNYRNSDKYEKQVVVNTPHIYRNPESYEKSIATNTPYSYRNSENYEKLVATNTPFRYRNYEKPVAVNTPYIYRNSEKPVGTNSLSSRNSQRLRRVKDRKPVRVESPESDKPRSLFRASDVNKSLDDDPMYPWGVRRNLQASRDSKEPSKSTASVDRPARVRDYRSRFRMFTKLSPPRSQLSDSEPQVVLTKLPDVHVNHQDGSVSAEMVKLCEMTQDRNPSLARKHKKLRCSVEKPPVLVSMKTVSKRASSPTSSLSTSPPCIHSLDEDDLPVNLTTSSSTPEKINRSSTALRLRSESEDSDCGLVIDFDRRTSIEERVPSPTLQSSAIIDGMKKASVSEDPRSFFSDQPVPSMSSEGTHRSFEEKEAGHTLLELTRSMLEPVRESIRVREGQVSYSAEEELWRGRKAREVRERDTDVSILRTLLLETGAIGPGPSRDRSQPGFDSSTYSADTSDPMAQEITRLLALCETRDKDSAAIGDRKFPLEMITHLNANSLITELEADRQDVKEQIRKLKNEIAYLKCVADKKDRERTAVVCFKRFKKEDRRGWLEGDSVNEIIELLLHYLMQQRIKMYKEEILKRVLHRFTSTLNDPAQDWIESNPNIPIDATDSVESTTSSVHPDDATQLQMSPRRQVSPITFHPTEMDPPESVTTSSESQDNCPTVVTEATATVAIDMRTVSSGTSTVVSTSISKAVLCSRDSSESSSEEETVQGTGGVVRHKTATNGTSTFSPADPSPSSIPSVSPNGNSTPSQRMGFFKSRSLTVLHASENSAFSATSSTLKNDYPIPLVVSGRKVKSSRKVHSYTTSSSPQHIPSSPFTLWGTDRNSFATASMDFQATCTDAIGPPYYNPFMLPPPPTNPHSMQPLKSSGRDRKSHCKAYNHKVDEDRLALSCSSLMSSSSSYGPPIVLGPSVVVNDATGATAQTGPPKCMGCGVEDGSLLCSGCRKHWYCSAKCQNLRWSEHKDECGSASEDIYNPGPSTSYN